MICCSASGQLPISSCSITEARHRAILVRYRYLARLSNGAPPRIATGSAIAALRKGSGSNRLITMGITLRHFG